MSLCLISRPNDVSKLTDAEAMITDRRTDR